MIYDHIHNIPLYRGLYPALDTKKENAKGSEAHSIFAVVFPDDAHIPQLTAGKPGAVKKVVVKVLMG